MKLSEIWIKYGFPSIEKFMKILKAKNYNYTYKEVEDFLSKQHTHQKHKQKHKKPYGHIIYLSPNAMWQCDLIDYQKYADQNKGYKWLLLCVDVFTRKGFGEKIKSKSTSDVVEAFKTIFRSKLDTPLGIMSDNGTEFTGKPIQTFFKSKNIIHITNNVHDHYALGLIDRFVRTIKSIIEKNFTHYGDNVWINIYQDIIDNYNNTPHSSLFGISPNEAKKYKLGLSKYYHELRLKTNKIKSIYDIGDSVRVRVEKDRKFGKGYKPNWSNEIYKIIDKKGKSYLVDDGTDKYWREYDLLVTEKKTR